MTYETIAERWRQLFYSGMASHEFFRHLNDTANAGWDDLRAQIGAITMIVNQAVNATTKLREQ